MLISTDVYLYNILQTLDLYTSQMSESYTPDTTVRVERYGSSEYRSLIQNALAGNDLVAPFIGVRFMRVLDNDTSRPNRSPERIAQYTDANKTDVITAPYPQPISAIYQLELRSPMDSWLIAMETEVLRFFTPVHNVELNASPLGPTIGPYGQQVRFFFEGARRVPTFPKEERLIRSVIPITVHTWLLPSSSLIKQVKTVKTVEVTFVDQTAGIDLDDRTF